MSYQYRKYKPYGAMVRRYPFKGQKRYYKRKYGAYRKGAGRKAMKRHPGALIGTRRPGPEMKSTDVPLTVGQFLASGAIYNLNVVNEGAGFWNRIARRIRMKSVQIRIIVLNLGLNPSNIQQDVKVRFLVVYDRQANGAQPTLASILQNYDSVGGATITPISFPNMDNKDRFIILKDQMVALPNVGVNGTYSSTPFWQADPNFPNSSYMDWYIPLRGLETHYRGSTNTYGDIATGGLLLVMQAMNLVAGDTESTWTSNFTARLRFTD